MTQTQTPVRHGAVYLRVEFGHMDDYAELADITAAISGVSDLLFFATFEEIMQSFPRDDVLSPQSVSVEAGRAALTANKSRVVRISYQSPLEIVLLVFVGAGTAAAVVKRISDAFISVQNARTSLHEANVSKSDADLRLAANQILRDRLDAANPNVYPQAEAAVPGAAEALSMMTSAETLQEGDV